MEKAKLAQEIKKISLLHGDFILRSGQHSTQYFDKYLFESTPVLLRAIIQHLKKCIPADTQILAGLEMGGIPLAVALSLEVNLPCVFVRKEAKEYGTKKITEGCEIRNKKVCVIEDIITTGGQVLLSTQAMRDEGAIIHTVLCVIDRGANPDRFQDSKLKLNSLFTKEDITA